MTSEDAGLHQVPVVCLYLFADDRVQGPLRVVRNNLLVIHFGGRLAEAADHVASSIKQDAVTSDQCIPNGIW